MLLAVPGTIVQMGLIVFGGLVGWRLYRDTIAVVEVPAPMTGTRGHVAAASALVAFFALLVVLPVLASATGSHHLAVFDSFYRSGSLVFGGGHVVLPLLRAEIVPPAWLTDDQFLAGYGAAQALPGPMFAFSAYLGAAMSPGLIGSAWLNGFWCLLGIFLPAWLLIGGVFPFWHRLRGKRWAQASLAGANAAVVGVLLAALYNPVFTESARGPREVALALLAFGLLELWKVPPWFVVALSAAAGQWLIAA